MRRACEWSLGLLQGVEIADKHIEIIIRQRLRKVKITEPGDTSMLWADQIDRLVFERENDRVVKMGGKPAEAVPVLLGITKASLETESSSPPRRSRTPRVSSPKPPPSAASITCAASRKTSSWATSSPRAPASRCTAK
jgi:hypothetical protein